MEVLRTREIDTNKFYVGDQIKVGKYTATCQKTVVNYSTNLFNAYGIVFGYLAEQASDEEMELICNLKRKYQPAPVSQYALFCLDQYLDKAYQMDDRRKIDSYEDSQLRKVLNTEIINDKNFDGIKKLLVPFENGDLLRIPTVGEMFGKNDDFEPDDNEQWPLMIDRRNRITSRKGEEYEWGWLQNRFKDSSANFAVVSGNGSAGYYGASSSRGVRPVFLLKCK